MGTIKELKNVKDLTGQRFGGLIVISLQPTESRKTYWICQCDCGEVKIVRSDNLQCGAIKSCGCLKKEQDKKNLTTHHNHMKSGTIIFKKWQGMKARCYDKHNSRFCRYGGRGITVCEEWKNDFTAFYDWAMDNGYKEDLTIDRIDNDKGYYPENCRWATIKEQCNNRSTNVKITIGNATKTLTQWCEIFNVKYKTINKRYHSNGFTSIEDLFN